MRRILFVFVALALLAGGTTGLSATEDPARAIARINGICTAEVIRPMLAVTASHCVGFIGGDEELEFVRGHAIITVEGTLVWDSLWFDGDTDGLDLAFVQLAQPWPHQLRLARLLPSSFPTYGYSVSAALGSIPFFKRLLLVEDMKHVSGLGWVLVYRGDTYPGASGSAVLDMSGEVIGLITHGYSAAHPPVLLGAAVGRIATALRDYDRRGRMVRCGEKDDCAIRREYDQP